MSDFTAAVLTLLLVSPSMIVLTVLIGRGVWNAWCRSNDPLTRH